MLYYPAKENSGLGTMALQLAGILVALSFTLDPGQRLLLLQDLATQTTLITLEQMLRGGQMISAIQETVAVGMLAGGLDLSRKIGGTVRKEQDARTNNPTRRGRLDSHYYAKRESYSDNSE